MQDYIIDRVREIAHYTINTSNTVRQTAQKFGVSKSTVHKDLVDRLPIINPLLAAEVRKVLDFNFAEKHLRGGIATQQKYRRLTQ